jgi:DNA repair protein RadC
MEVSEVKLTYKSIAKDRVRVTSSRKVYEVFKPFYEEDMDYKEYSFIMYLNRQNEILGVLKLSEGGCSGTVIDPKILMQGALLVNAQAVIISHNHPSGTLRPSEADDVLTKKIKQLGELMDLPLLDHVILTSNGYYSYQDEGKL